MNDLTMNNNPRAHFGRINYQNEPRMPHRAVQKSFTPSPLGRCQTNGFQSERYEIDRWKLPTATDNEHSRSTQTENIYQNKGKNRGGCYKAMGAMFVVKGLAMVGGAMYLHYAPNEQVYIHPNIIMGLGIGGLMPLSVGLVLAGMGISKSP